jgi:uncharacterized integral membrane protein (TIGR00698 family)
MGLPIDINEVEARIRRWAPGVGLATLITVVALALGTIQERLFDFAALEPLVLALLIGLAVRALWLPRDIFLPGIGFAAKQLLEFAIVLLGASLNLAAIVDAGMHLLAAVLISVAVTLAVGVVLGRAAGLGPRLAILVAAGNAICGNSAIAAVAPVIRARKQEVASAIAMTAVLGVGVVLTLPMLVGVFDLTDERYGVIAGLTVYAVPQVLAATIPVSAEAGQIASLVKLTRVLLLGPVVAIFAWLYRTDSDDDSPGTGRSFGTFLPWFVIGFAVLTLLRTMSILPEEVADAAREASKLLTSVAMAGLGLSVDLRSVRESGVRVGLVVITLTLLLVAMAITIVTTMGIG